VVNIRENVQFLVNLGTSHSNHSNHNCLSKKNGKKLEQSFDCIVAIWVIKEELLQAQEEGSSK
jgi:hypothetical protein